MVAEGETHQFTDLADLVALPLPILPAEPPTPAGNVPPLLAMLMTEGKGQRNLAPGMTPVGVSPAATRSETVLPFVLPQKDVKFAPRPGVVAGQNDYG